MMSFLHQLYYLSNQFYQAYPETLFTEIEQKNTRRYICLIIETHDGYFICIPYRTNINHNYAYLFKNSQRSKKHRSGLDYTKTVIISDNNYLDGSQPALVDNDEYIETIQNIHRIVREITIYIEDYITYIKGSAIISKEEFTRRYKYSTLSYFHDILGI